MARAKTFHAPAKMSKLEGQAEPVPPPGIPEQLARVYAALKDIPGVVEKTAWGSPTFRTGRHKTDRMFAIFAVNHHGDGRVSVWCAAPPGTQALLAETAPDRTFVPPYMGVSGWIGVQLLKTDNAQLAHHLREAWCYVAPKKRLAGCLNAV